MNTSSVRTRSVVPIPGCVTFLSPLLSHVCVTSLPCQDPLLKPLEMSPAGSGGAGTAGRGAMLEGTLMPFPALLSLPCVTLVTVFRLLPATVNTLWFGLFYTRF